MRIVDFTAAHIEQAMRIAKLNYDEERGFAPALPPIGAVPDLAPYAGNSLGVAAFENGQMLGFLCCVSPFNNAFSSTDAVGVFSPMGANGALGENRAMVYARMYQAAGEKWVRAGASSHAICLYAHEKEIQRQFFLYGFGMRCVDAIRRLDDITEPTCDGFAFSEIAADEALEVLPLENLQHKGFIESPFFLLRSEHSENDWLRYWAASDPVCFAAKHESRTIAYILAESDGENFIRDTEGYLHITGMYCLPEHRGQGVSHKLLNLLIQKLRGNGYTRLGADFESINPSGFGFWTKHFTVYTHSVVRRIDEYAIPPTHTS
ncbi:MAG: GNAT family N-acetyltransferase [Clostridiales bacterium]|nr:GNAT family N-acetyltransferase [Clostridiales bacterium]